MIIWISKLRAPRFFYCEQVEKTLEFRWICMMLYLGAHNDVTASFIGHTIAKLNFFRDTGILQVRPDGMWEQ